MHERTSRRAFLALLPAVALTLAAGRRNIATGCPQGRPSRSNGHPDPRPGIDASNVIPADRLSGEVAEVFDMIREIPQIVDGIGCKCGCADIPDMYSLLSCYENDVMAQYCVICKGQGRLVYRLHGEGRTLDQIRAAVDARYG